MGDGMALHPLQRLTALVRGTCSGTPCPAFLLGNPADGLE